MKTELPRVRCLAAHSSSLSDAREFVRERGAEYDLSPEAMDELVLAVSEACLNAVDHADTLLLFVSWRAEDGRVEVQVKDDGVFQRRIPLLSADERERGFGMRLMMGLVDEFGISEGTAESPGTVVRLRKKVDDIVVLPEASPRAS